MTKNFVETKYSFVQLIHATVIIIKPQPKKLHGGRRGFKITKRHVLILINLNNLVIMQFTFQKNLNHYPKPQLNLISQDRKKLTGPLQKGLSQQPSRETGASHPHIH